MKHRVKSIFLYLVFMTIFIQTLTSSAAKPAMKEEIIYANLTNEGAVTGVYVVNSFLNDEASVITDFGEYDNVINLTNSNDIEYENGKISINTDKGNFYYQGNLKSERLPWNINISYYLNGTIIKASELAGKSGELKTVIAVTRNDAVNQIFFDNYTIQINVTLDMELCSEIKTTGATITTAGNKKQLSYTIMPGTEKDFIYTAKVVNFEMDPITIACINADFSLDLNAIDFSRMTKDINKLETGISELDNGIQEITLNSEQIRDAVAQYTDGVEEYISGTGRLSEGAGSLAEGVSSLGSGLEIISANGTDLAKGAQAMLEATFNTVNTSLALKLKDFGIDAPVLNKDNYATVLSGMIEAYQASADELNALKSQLDSAVDFYTGVVEYTLAVNSIYESSISLSEGANSLKVGLDKAYSSSMSLSSGGKDLNKGIYSLTDGFKELSYGSNQLRTETIGLEDKVKGEIDILIGETLEKYSGHFEAVSFTSDKNANIQSVQFILKTQGIKIEQPNTVQIDEPKKLNLLQRFLKLFGLYD